MKITFFGTSEFAVPALEALCGAGFDVLVVTTPDKPAGRKRELTPSPVKLAAEKLGLPVHQPNSLKDFEVEPSDFCVVAAYGKMIPQTLIDSPKKGFLNIHPSLLPKYRGPTPIQAAILNGETETGISIMQIDKEMDHGPVYLQQKFNIGPDETYLQLHGRLAAEGAKMLLEVINNFENYPPQAQNHAEATFCKIFSRENGKIDWSKPATEIYNQIRALNPEPGTWTTWQDKNLNIKSARLTQIKANAPGIICKEGNKLAVGTGEGSLELNIIQLEGKKEVLALEFSQGHPDLIDSKLK